jgi:carbamoyltransferase
MSKRHHTLGVYVGAHGASVTLLIDGVPVVATQLERITGIKRAWVVGKKLNREFAIERVKHDFQENLLDFDAYFPLVLKYVLDAAKITLDDVDLVALEARNLLNSSDSSYEIYEDDELDQLFRGCNIVRVEHHQAHQAQAFYASPFHEAAIITVDGRSWDRVERLGDTMSLTISKGTDNGIQTLYESNHSLTSLYYSISLQLFGKRYSEGKTMGLAPYGADNVFGVRIEGDVSTQYQIDHLCVARHVLDCRQKALPGEFFCAKHKEENDQFVANWLTNIVTWHTEAQGLKCINKTDNLNFQITATSHNLHSFQGVTVLKKGAEPTLPQRQVAYLCQRYYEESLLTILNAAHEETGLDRLCIAGGGGLNSVANKKILDETKFKELFVFPNCGDEGLSCGFALWAYYNHLHRPRTWKMQHDFIGRVYSRQEIDRALAQVGSSITAIDCGLEIYVRTAQLLADGKIVGWFQGGAEFGPRALGHRSILAHPGIPDMKDILNARVKHREDWRPFAPSVLAEYSREYFDLDVESPYMLLVAPVRPDKRQLIPSVTHVDGTARLQTVRAEADPHFYKLISEFSRLTSLPMLLNTSLNIGGKPIVETPEQALECYLSTHMDALVIDTFLVTKNLS